mmetsp:Transcript_33064/g.74213  ORF Transcript_33064/g.74213 Transcript_33064/m.74213 type:complete len:682 (-) Transcript_33064:15-2060(-)
MSRVPSKESLHLAMINQDSMEEILPGSASNALKRRKLDAETLQSKKRREQVGRACEPCRRAKMKCDEQRPCSTCKSRDISHRCIDEVSFETIRGVLKLPVASKEVIEIRTEQSKQGTLQQRSIELECGDETTSFANRCRHLADKMPLIELGWKREQVVQLLMGLPASLFDTLSKGLIAVERLYTIHKEVSRPRAGSLSKQLLAEDRELRIDAMECDMCNSHPSLGVFRVEYCPSTGHASSLYMNQAFASILGSTRDKLLHQISCCQVPLALSASEYVSFVLGLMNSFMPVQHSSVLRVLPQNSEQPVFVRAHQKRTFGQYGNLICVTHFWSLVEPEDCPADLGFGVCPADKLKVSKEFLFDAAREIDLPLVQLETRSLQGAELVRTLQASAEAVFKPFMTSEAVAGYMGFSSSASSPPKSFSKHEKQPKSVIGVVAGGEGCLATFGTSGLDACRSSSTCDAGVEDGLGCLTSCLNVAVESKASGVQHLVRGPANHNEGDRASARDMRATKSQSVDVPSGVSMTLNDLSGLASFLGANTMQTNQPAMNHFPGMSSSNAAAASSLPRGSSVRQTIGSQNGTTVGHDAVVQAQFPPMQVNALQQLQARAAGIQANLQAHIEGVQAASKLANQLQGIQQQLENAKARLQQQLEVTNRSMLLVPSRGGTPGSSSYPGTSEMYNNHL